MGINNDAVMSTELQTSLLIEHAKKMLLPLEEYSSPWLKEGSIGSAKWIVNSSNSKRVRKINFDQPLANGTRLTAPENSIILKAIQKWMFHLRQGNFGSNLGFDTWMTRVRFAFNLASWLTLYEDLHNPQKFAFKLLNDNSCKILIEDYTKGGWPSALLFKERITEHFCQISGQEYDGSSELSSDQVQKIIDYLSQHKLYIGHKNSKPSTSGIISRKYLAEFLGTNTAAFYHPSIRSFLRTFETNFENERLLSEAKIRRAQYHSQNTKISESDDIDRIAKSSLQQFIILLRSLLCGSNLLPDDIPNITINISELLKNSNSRPDNHTNKIPHSIGMYALSKSIEWVMVYGKAIVNATSDLVRAFNDPSQNLKPNSNPQTIQQKHFEIIIKEYFTDQFDNLPSKPLSEVLNIKKLTSQSFRTSTKESMCFAVAIECFIAACAIVIGMLKPIRVEELVNIKRNALDIQDPGEGAFLTHPVEKTRQQGGMPLIRRPISYITAKAIQLLSVLGANLKEIYKDDSQHSTDLFYFPSSKAFRCPSGERTSIRVDAAIRSFCDIIEMPVDIFGRRWYIKTHEMRKFFILTMHRHERVYTEDSLRYHAGQADPKHLQDYLSGDIPDEEFYRYTIECIEDQMMEFEEIKQHDNTKKGLSALYLHTLKYFSINSLRSRPDYEFDEFLKTLLREGLIETSIYTIKLKTYTSEVIDTTIAIKFGENTDENFNY